MENEKERILKAGGFIQVGRVNGRDAELKQNKQLPVEMQIVTANPDITSVELCDDDEFLVIACDGIWDCMSSQQLVDYVREQLKHESKLSVVWAKTRLQFNKGCDNMTMILVQFKKPINSAASVENQPIASNPSSEKEKTTSKAK
ncbi:hypothetical protein ACFX11_046885 [Malus domestica]